MTTSRLASYSRLNTEVHLTFKSKMLGQTENMVIPIKLWAKQKALYTSALELSRESPQVFVYKVSAYQGPKVKGTQERRWIVSLVQGPAPVEKLHKEFKALLLEEIAKTLHAEPKRVTIPREAWELTGGNNVAL